jgi:outer membrane protein assembly factor BamA
MRFGGLHMRARVVAETLLLFLTLAPVSWGQQGQVSGILFKPENIIFIGNTSLSTEDLRDIFRNAGVVTAQLSPESMDVYNTDRIKHGLNMVLAFYRNRGFVRANISEPETDFVPSESGSKIRLLLKVNEGGTYSPGQIKITGTKLFNESVLISMLNVQPGQPLSLTKLNAGVQAIQKAYLSLGYLDIDIQTSVNPIEKKKLADIVLTIKEGSQYHVGTVALVGSSPIKPSLLQEFLPLQAGDIFAERTYDACLQILNELGITPVLTDSDISFKVDREKSLVNLAIDLEGKPSRK